MGRPRKNPELSGDSGKPQLFENIEQLEEKKQLSSNPEQLRFPEIEAKRQKELEEYQRKLAEHTQRSFYDEIKLVDGQIVHTTNNNDGVSDKRRKEWEEYQLKLKAHTQQSFRSNS